jgi:hypothetical protein
MNINYDYLLSLIELNKFSCYEDAIDLIQEYYKSGKISLLERNMLINIL